MKRTILVLFAVSALIVAQDAAGQYKLTGVDVLYTFVTRAENTLTVTEASGTFPVTVPVATIPAAVPFTTKAMQLPDAALSAIGINLNVTLNEDGTGAIAEGSYYPDVNTITDADGNCVTLQQVLPVTDEFTYQSMGNMMAYVGMAHPGINVLGLPGVSQYAGQQLGGLQLSSSLTFENFPMFPAHPTICSPTGDCFPFTTGDYDQDGTVQVYPALNALGFAEYVPGGAPLTGLTAGYWLKTGVNAGALSSTFAADTNNDGVIDVDEGNTTPDFHLEWHGVDGVDADLGWGDDRDLDEDGDGTWFDRIVGIPGITATYMNPACGFNMPIYGDLTGSAYDDAGCVDHVDAAASGYLMDPTGAAATWGNFVTANGVLFSGTYAACSAEGAGLFNMIYGGCLAAATSACEGAGGVWEAIYGGCIAGGGDPATCAGAADAGGVPAGSGTAYCAAAAAALGDCVNVATGAVAGYTDCAGYCTAMYGANDSDHDFDGTDGRLTMDFDIPCVGIIEAREVIAEFIEVGGGDCGTGDMNADGGLNVLDVVALVNQVLGGGSDSCIGDMNADGGLNVLDVVALVNQVLGGGRADEATSATFEVIGNEVTMTANGYVGAVQMTLSHGKDFQIDLTDNAFAADYRTKGYTTTLIVVVPEGNALFTTNGEFTIESVLAASNADSYMDTKVVVPGDFAISAAYPNPFNPTTQMTLALHTQADVSVKVFNMAGQLVDVIAEGQMDKGSYSLTWDAANVSSGVYFIKTEVGSVVQNQKIMLIK